MTTSDAAKAGDCRVYDIETHALIRVDKALTKAQIKKIQSKGVPQPGSIAMRIKDDPALWEKYNRNMERYYADFEARKLQDTKGMNATDMFEDRPTKFRT